MGARRYCVVFRRPPPPSLTNYPQFLLSLCKFGGQEDLNVASSCGRSSVSINVKWRRINKAIRVDLQCNRFLARELSTVITKLSSRLLLN